MEIDPGKVALSEKDIEDFLFENPSRIKVGLFHVKRWVKRQYSVPSGIIDLLGIIENGRFVVVEVKNVPIDAKALTQVCRYAFDVESILSGATLNMGIPTSSPIVEKVVIGRSVDNKTFCEAEAIGVEVSIFAVRLNLEVSGPLGWTTEAVRGRCDAHRVLEDDRELYAALHERLQALEEQRESRRTVQENIRVQATDQ